MPHSYEGYAISSALSNLIIDCSLPDNELIDTLKKNGILITLNITEAKEKIYKNFAGSDWPKKIADFMLQQPISRKVPGETVSLSYRNRAPKFLRNYTLEESMYMFQKLYPEFKYKLSLFSSAVPKNVVQPSVKEVVQNVCVIFSNVRKQSASLNNLMVRLRKTDLMVPLRSSRMVEKLICTNIPGFDIDNVNTWHIDCCSNNCKHCGPDKYIKSLKETNSVFFNLVLCNRIRQESPKAPQ